MAYPRKLLFSGLALISSLTLCGCSASLYIRGRAISNYMTSSGFTTVNSDSILKTIQGDPIEKVKITFYGYVKDSVIQKVPYGEVENVFEETIYTDSLGFFELKARIVPNIFGKEMGAIRWEKDGFKSDTAFFYYRGGDTLRIVLNLERI